MSDLYNHLVGKDVVVQLMMPWLVVAVDPAGAARTAKDENGNMMQLPSVAGKLLSASASGIVLEFADFGGRDFVGTMCLQLPLVGHVTAFEKAIPKSPILLVKP